MKFIDGVCCHLARNDPTLDTLHWVPSGITDEDEDDAVVCDFQDDLFQSLGAPSALQHNTHLQSLRLLDSDWSLITPRGAQDLAAAPWNSVPNG